MSDTHVTFSAPTPRTYGLFNWLGLWTLYKREVGRFPESLDADFVGTGDHNPAVHDRVQAGLRRSR